MINYPMGLKVNKKSVVIGGNKHGGRGLQLEEEINLSNKYYKTHDIAIIYKKPTPIRVVKVIQCGKLRNKITEAYYQEASTTDYNGIYKRHYIDFEVKQTNSTESFTLNATQKHQLKHLISIRNHGGIAFIIVRFNKLGVTFVLDVNLVIECKKLKQKSIKYDIIKNEGYFINESLYPRIDYLKAVDILISKRCSSEK